MSSKRHKNDLLLTSQSVPEDIVRAKESFFKRLAYLKTLVISLFEISVFFFFSSAPAYKMYHINTLIRIGNIYSA